MKFKKIMACVDMYGCPNRCKHCWIGHSRNGNMTIDDLKGVAEAFRPFAESLEIHDWYREPDYKDNYKELWQLCNALSDERAEHFEVISVWRLVRDSNYVKWLAALGLKKAQLTLFGDKQTTDYYTGRKGAFEEIMDGIEILLQNGIVPRIQVFINKNNSNQLNYLDKLIKELDLEKRCSDIGGDFSMFIHQGSCDGENQNFYDSWITHDDIDEIPLKLKEYTLKHFDKSDLRDVFGKPEKELYKELIQEMGTSNYISETPTFFIDKDFNVYPNIAAPATIWYLGNLKKDDMESILENYLKKKSIGQHMCSTVPIGTMVKQCGSKDSMRLFLKDEYILYIQNKYCTLQI